MAIEKTKNGWSVQLRIGRGRRLNFPITAPHEAAAETRAAVMTELSRLLVDKGRLLEAKGALTSLGQAETVEEATALYDELRALCAEPLPPARKGSLTFRELGDEWTSGRLAKKYPGHVKVKKSKDDDANKLAVLNVTLGDIQLCLLTLDDADRAMAALPVTVQSDSTRRQYAQVIRKLMALAVYPCKLIAESPIPKGFCPKAAKPPQFQCLYPTEDARLMACATLDLHERVLYGLAVRIGLRAANLFDLTWRKVDLVNGILHTLAKDTSGGTEGKWIEFDISPDIVAVLTALRALAADLPDTATVFPQFDRTTITKRLHAALRAAGVDRLALFEATTGSEPLRFHDLRASFTTFAMLNGRSDSWITDRTGHTTSQMLYKYKRPHLARLPMTDWLPLDVALGLAAPVALPDAVGEVDDHATRQLAGDQAGALPLPAPELAAHLADEIPALGGSSHLEAFQEVSIAEGATGLHEGLANHGVFGWQRVAADVAVKFFGVTVSMEEALEISTGFQGGSKGARTPDLRIKSSTQNITNPHKTSPLVHETTRDDSRRLETARELPPMSSLGEDDLAELCEAMTTSKRWHLVAKLATDLDAIAQSRATRSNVTPLLVERRRKA